jgi:hypothetical protein
MVTLLRAPEKMAQDEPMKPYRWVFGAATVAVVGGGLGSGCGSSSPGPATDSGVEAMADSGAEAAADACFGVDANFLSMLPSLDAGDAGGPLACAACVQSQCSMPISACQSSCTCLSSAAGCFLSADAGAVASCVLSNPQLASVGACILFSCSTSCASLLLGGGGGPGNTDGGAETAPGSAVDAASPGETGADAVTEAATPDGGADASEAGSVD